MCPIAARSAFENTGANAVNVGAQNEPVVADVKLSNDRLPSGGKCRCAIVLNIKDGWHINQNPPQPAYLIATKVTLKSKLGAKLVDVSYPNGHKFVKSGEPLIVYGGQSTVFGIVDAPMDTEGQTEELEWEIHYQASTDEACLPPKSLKITREINVAPQGEPVNSINENIFKSANPAK